MLLYEDLVHARFLNADTFHPSHIPRPTPPPPPSTNCLASLFFFSATKNCAFSRLNLFNLILWK